MGKRIINSLLVLLLAGIGLSKSAVTTESNNFAVLSEGEMKAVWGGGCDEHCVEEDVCEIRCYGTDPCLSCEKGDFSHEDCVENEGTECVVDNPTSCGAVIQGFCTGGAQPRCGGLSVGYQCPRRQCHDE